ncbi:MAG: response regulator transcription factor [Chloroflexi bacterium]|nr:response regulator transcription factor [Chloroflexota bacterium]
MQSNPLITDFPLRVLVVDDERPIRRFLSASLGEHFNISEAESGNDALRVAAVDRPDLVILDLGLPDMDGTDVTRRLREWTDVPVIIISVRDRDEDKIAALDAGADDYLTKPFSAGELMARIRAALRRAVKPENESVYQSGDLVVDLQKREVRVRDLYVTLTPTEYDILRVLVNHAGRVLTHKQLIQEVWGGNYEADPHLLRVNVSNLRKKIEMDPLLPRHIITEPGVGYRLKNIEDNRE